MQKQINNLLQLFCIFICIYIDDIIVFLKILIKYLNHLQLIFFILIKCHISLLLIKSYLDYFTVLLLKQYIDALSF